jgi:hypothetical protein
MIMTALGERVRRNVDPQNGSYSQSSDQILLNPTRQSRVE